MKILVCNCFRFSCVVWLSILCSSLLEIFIGGI